MHRSGEAVGALLLLAIGAGGCRTAAPPVPTTRLAEGVAALTRPLPGNLAALYHLRVPQTGGLRLSILTSGPAGRLTVSEPFGSAVSIAAWSDGAAGARLYDLQSSCRMAARDVASVLGVGRLPLPQASRLLGGRLPALGEDDIEVNPGQGALDITGDGWACRSVLAADPWRVVRVEGAGWTVVLDRHTASVPGFARFSHQDGRWAELELVRLEWPNDPALPAEPELPPCAAAEGAPE